MEHNRNILAVVIGRIIAGGIAIVVAGCLAYKGLDGWGWFLFIGLWLGAITVATD